VERNWAGPLTGLVVTRYGYAVPCERIDIMEAAHPVPDAAGLQAARRILDRVQGLSADDTVLCLISGGGSSLPLPLEGITLEDKQKVNRALLQSGATISEMNCVRRHLSAIKGGRLAAACHPAKVVTLLISDVPGDDPRDIASGPTVADASTCADALAIIQRYAIELPERVLEVLRAAVENPSSQAIHAWPTAKSTSSPHRRWRWKPPPAWQRGRHHRPHPRRQHRRRSARRRQVMAGIALRCAARAAVCSPCVLLSGGETTVTVRHRPWGPQCRVPALLRHRPARSSQGPRLAGDTDGVDGLEDNRRRLHAQTRWHAPANRPAPRRQPR
jgi:hydroxypyruvate reductase